MQRLKNKLTEKLSNANEFSTVKNDTAGSERDDNIIHLKNHQEQNTSAVPDFAISMNEAKSRITMLQDFVKKMMIPEIDYGMVPGCKKPSLFKSGAEKLGDIFGLSKHVEVINRLEDWDKRIFHYEVKVTLVNKKTGLIEAEGIGSCNTKEKKYAVHDGCSFITTVLKMAKKRALVDAMLSATRTSGLFSQDLEELDAGIIGADENSKFANAADDLSQPEQENIQKPEKMASKNQLALIISLVSKKIISIGDVKKLMLDRYNVTESKLLSSRQASDLIKYLNNIKKDNLGVD